MIEKQVGIITYHHNSNYGTMLQAIALQKAIQRNGYSSELINYEARPVAGMQLFKLRLKRLGVYVLHFTKYYTLLNNKPNITAREVFFEDFYKKYAVVGKTRYESIEELRNAPPRYKLYIVGSDQTWSPPITSSKEAFYLTFVPQESIKGSYGPSIGVSILEEKDKELLKDKLKDFKYLSCREKTGTRILSELLNKPITTVLDPTLLLEEKEWLEMSDVTIDNVICEKPYILQYFLGSKSEHREFVKELSKKTGHKIICLPFDTLDMRDSSVIKLYIGPAQFLRLIYNAAYVCTDSFHGTVFSVIFKRNFFSFYKHSYNHLYSENSRIYDFLDSINLTDRIVMDDQIASSLSLEVDFDKVKHYLSKLKVSSEKYLLDMLSKELG